MKNRILLGVTAGISIYKVCGLVSRLKKEGYELKIIMTENAEKLINPLVFETLGNTKVYTDMFHPGHHDFVEHIELAKWADLFLIAPATANTLAKIAHGIADNMLTSTALAYGKPIHFCVAMNTNMLENSSTQENIRILQERNHKILSSNVGLLACNTYGNGRMKEPDEIFSHIEEYFTEKDLTRKKILITAGSTLERLDPVRYLSNDSSGKMGIALAKQAKSRGADVTLILGHHTAPVDFDVPIIHVSTTLAMRDAVLQEFGQQDALIMASAPCDYRPKNPLKLKMKKKHTDITIVLEENPDILREVAKIKKHQTVIGFAAETDNVIANAKEKRRKKSLDYIVANDVTKAGAGFNVNTNIATIISEDSVVAYELMSKRELADKILNLLKG